MSKELVVKSNRIIEASYKLTMGEQRLILLCIRQIKKDQEIVGGKSKKKKKLIEATEFSVHAEDFADMFEISQKRAYTELQIVADRLYDRSVIIHNPYVENPAISALKTRWISAIEYMPKEGRVTLSFAKKMIPYISKLEGGFTRYNLQNIADMNSVYGIRFYEFFKCWLFGSTKKTKRVSLDELKEKLQLTGKYPSIKDFKLYVLDKALQDINNFSDLGAKYKALKTGRKITHIEFDFWVKNKKKDSPQETKTVKIDNSYIEKHARPGETYEQAAKRLREATRQQ